MPPQPPASARTPLGQRVRSAALWTGLGHAAVLALRFGSSLVLTRLLAPDMYGVMAIGNVLVAAVTLLSDVGLAQNVIQSRRGDEPRFLRTVWSIQIARGFGLSALLGLLALLIVQAQAWMPGGLPGAYASPALPQVVLILALVPGIAGFESTRVLRARRDLRLGPLARMELVTQVLATALTILLAWRWPAPWVLPVSWVALGLFRVLLSHTTLPGASDRVGWDPETAREVWGFSKWLMASGLPTFLFREGDRLLLALFLSPAALGVYMIGTLMLGAVQAINDKLAGIVGLPALAEKARESPQALALAYRRLRRPIDVFCVGWSGVLMGGGPAIVSWLYDPRYQLAGVALQVLSLNLLAIRHTLFDQYLLAEGESRLVFYRSLLRASVLYAAVPIGHALGGTVGAIMGVSLAYLSVIPLVLHLQARRGLLDWRQELRTLSLLAPAFLVGWCLPLRPVVQGP